MLLLKKNALRWNDNKRIQSLTSTDILAYGISKNLICHKEKTKCNNQIKQWKK